MKSRALASIALGAAVILGTAGCSMISPQATTIHYAAAEGVNVPASAGPITARNVFFVIGEGDTANLVASFSNPTTKDATIVVALAGGETITVDVPALGAVNFGVDEQRTFTNFTVPVGANAEVAFTSGDGQTTTVKVPVLDATMAYLEEAVPTPTPSATN